MYDFDLFVIGAGSGGVRMARMSAGYGARVAIAEDRYLGGTCVNVGCVPKKLYSYASHYRYDFEDSAGYGWSSLETRFDWNILRDNKKQEISRLNGVYDRLLQKAGVKLINGRARLLDPHTVAVGETRHTAQYILIATGGWPYIPKIPGHQYAISSNEVFDLPQFPSRILVVGGGYIAVEFAGILAGLGAKTWLSYRKDMPLRGFDQDIRQFFLQECQRHLNLMMNTQVSRIDKTTKGAYKVVFEHGEELEVDCVLFATGRKPNVDGLGLEHTGVKTDSNGAIQVDNKFCTAEPSIYALGDVVGRKELTPVAIAEGMVLSNNLFGKGDAVMHYENIPTAVFSHPNIGTVGLSQEEAEQQGYKVDAYKSDFRQLKNTLSGRDDRTLMKVIVNSDNDKVLGIHMVGAEAGEIIQGFAVAMNCGVTKSQLDATLGIHPTSAEEFVTMRSRQ